MEGKRKKQRPQRQRSDTKIVYGPKLHNKGGGRILRANIEK